MSKERKPRQDPRQAERDAYEERLAQPFVSRRGSHFTASDGKQTRAFGSAEAAHAFAYGSGKDKKEAEEAALEPAAERNLENQATVVADTVIVQGESVKAERSKPNKAQGPAKKGSK